MSKQARNRSRGARIAKELADRRARQRKRLLAGGGLVIVGLLVAIVISLVNAAGNASAGNEAVTGKDVVNPAAATADGAIPVGRADAPVKVQIYLDYMCPFCGRFERANAAELERLVMDGTVQLQVYPMSFLDRQSDGTRYSTRAANSVVTVADGAPDKMMAFNNALFARQPAEGGPGLTNDEIATLAADSGVPPEASAGSATRPSSRGSPSSPSRPSKRGSPAHRP